MAAARATNGLRVQQTIRAFDELRRGRAVAKVADLASGQSTARA